jgi:hypothetical protein
VYQRECGIALAAQPKRLLERGARRLRSIDSTKDTGRFGHGAPSGDDFVFGALRPVARTHPPRGKFGTVSHHSGSND